MMKHLTCISLLIGIFFNSYVLAQPELDTTFASTGKRILQFGAIGRTEDLAVQPDNKIVLLGPCFALYNGGVFPFCLLRLNENGSFDTTFGGTSGTPSGIPSVVFTRIPGASDSGFSNSIAIQNDGKIVAVGYATFSNQERLVIVRYNSNGSLDSSFGTDGIVNTAINADARANELVIQPDGKIIVVGYSQTSTTSPAQQFVARYSSNGTLDSSFGNGGIATISIPGNSTSGFSIALQADGKILTGGLISAPGSPTPSVSYLLTRLNPDGALDTTFDGDGLLTTVYGALGSSNQGFVSLAVQNDGRIVALGDKNILYRFNSDGSLDTSFDADGSRPALNGNSDSYDLTVTTSGKITVVGFPTYVGLPFDYRVARYLPNGSPDPNFSGDGFLDIDVGGSNDGATAVALDSQGRIVIGGRSALGGRVPWENSMFSVARLTAAPVQNVGFSGRIIQPDGRPVANAAITLKRDSETIGYGRTNPFGYFRIPNVQSGQTYTISVNAKRLVFNDRSVLVDDEITSFNLISEQPSLPQEK